jgi:hypothetical protein
MIRSSLVAQETIDYRPLNAGVFVNRLHHRQKALKTVESHSGIQIPIALHAAKEWEGAHSVDHLLDGCPRPWQECLSHEPRFNDPVIEAQCRYEWSQGRAGKNARNYAIAQAPKAQYVAFVEAYGPDVVFVSASNPLAHMGLETRTQPATMRKIEGTDSLEMLNPDYLGAPVETGTVLLGNDCTGLGDDAHQEFAQLEALRTTIRSGIKEGRPTPRAERTLTSLTEEFTHRYEEQNV